MTTSSALRKRLLDVRPALDDQLQGYLDHLTIERGVAANTLSSYRRDLRRYAEHLTSAASTTWPRSPRPTSATSWSRCAAATRTPEPRRCRRCRRPAH